MLYIYFLQLNLAVMNALLVNSICFELSKTSRFSREMMNQVTSGERRLMRIVLDYDIH